MERIGRKLTEEYGAGRQAQQNIPNLIRFGRVM